MSLKNKAWIEEVESTLSPLFDLTHIQYYNHWESGEETMDFNTEQEKLANIASKLGKYTVFAKSAGALLTLRAIYEGKIAPSKCVFCGVAYGMGKDPAIGSTDGKNVDDWLTGYSVPTLFIHKEHDPVADSKEFENILKEKMVANMKFVKIPGDNHNYENLEQIRGLTDQFIKA